MLPPLYQMEDYGSCIQNGGEYCKVHAVLEIPSNNISLLNLLNKIVSYPEKFDRRVIYRALCLQTSTVSDNQTTKVRLSNLVNQKIENYNLTTKIDYYLCTNGKTETTTFDNFILYSVIAYLLFVTFATYYVTKYRDNNYFTGTKSMLSHFSLIKGWRNRTNVTKNEDFKKLLSMQGIRGFTLLFLLFGHVVTNYMLIYIRDPESFEKAMELSAVQAIKNFSPHVVLVFFLMSSWLSTMQVYNTYQKLGKFSIKDVGIAIINRYFRFSTAILLVLIWNSNWIHKLGGPLNFDLLYGGQETCKNYWIYNVLYVNNFLVCGNICNAPSWYLSADFQMFIINTLTVYAILKYKLSEFKTYGAVLLISILVHGMTLYYFNIDLLFRFTIRTFEIRNFPQSEEMLVSYFSPTSIASSSCIGMIMGTIYLKTKKRKFNIKWPVTTIYVVLSIGLPSLAIAITMTSYGLLQGAILGSIIKPIYCLGLGIGFLGMSRHSEGVFKKILENRFIVVLGNFSFSIYISHWLFIISRHKHTPAINDLYTLVTDFVAAVLTACLVGIFVTLTVEEPLLSLQKKILPQFEKAGPKKLKK